MITGLPRLGRRFVLASVATAAAVMAAACWPDKAHGTLLFVIASFVDVGPLIAIGLIISAWVAASGAGDVTASLFRGRPFVVIVIASAIGAVTPVRSTASDLLTFLEMALNLKESPLAPALATTLAKRRPAGMHDENVGLGWVIAKSGDDEMIWHTAAPADTAPLLVSCRTRGSALSCFQTPPPRWASTTSDSIY